MTAPEVIIGYANEDGGGGGNWSARQDAGQVIGHLQHYHTREGRRIRLARYRDERPYIAPEPYVHDVRRTVKEIIGGLIVCALFVVGGWLWSGIAWAAQAPTP